MKFNTPRGLGFLELRIKVHIQVNYKKLNIYTAPACIFYRLYTLHRLRLQVSWFVDLTGPLCSSFSPAIPPDIRLVYHGIEYLIH